MSGTHHHGAGMGSDRLRLALALTTVILVVEVVGGLLAHSLALLSDAGHVVTDLAALALAWYATRQAGRPADARKTYGYHRTGILAALANAVTLIVIVLVIAYEAIARFQHPQQVTPAVMIAAAAVGLVVNLLIGAGLHQHAEQNLNLRAAWLHVVGDAAASAGVIVGGVLIAVTGWSAADPLISLAIAVLIARGAWFILRETVDILMEAAPAGLDVGQLVRDVNAERGVADLHDLHVWTIAGGMHALSAHIQVEDQMLSRCDELLARVNHLLVDRYQISHSTLQFECAGCESRVLYCSLSAEDGHDHGEEEASGGLRPEVLAGARG